MNYLNNLRHVRKLLRKTQADFNEYGFNKGKVQSYEDGRSQPRIEFLILLKNLSGISIDDILTGDLGNMPQYSLKKSHTNIVSEPKSNYLSPSEAEKINISALLEKVTDLEKRLQKVEAQLNKR